MDKAYALIAYRAIFIDAEVVLLNDDQAHVTVSVESFLKNFEELNKKKKTVSVDGFETVLYPLSEFSYEGEVSIFDCIESITFNGVTVTGSDIPAVLDKLPAKVFSTVSKAIIEDFNALSEIEVLPPNEYAKIKGISVSLVNGSFKDFILALFRGNMDNMFDSMYIFSQHFGSFDYFDLTPLDSRVLENILKRELDRAAKQNNKPQHINPLTPDL